MTDDVQLPAVGATRRRLLLGGAATATTAVATQALAPGPATAGVRARTYTTNPYTATTVPTSAERHMMNRMGFGYSRSTFKRMVAAGGPVDWFEEQLHPASVKESSKALDLPTWFPDKDQSPSVKWGRQASADKGGWEFAEDLAGYTMLRRMYSERPVFENMVDFWSNHLHVHAAGDLCWVQRASYDRLIRRHALGRFDTLLVEAALHPAMLLYLDNWTSTKDAPNENQGRELLELHTVGVTSGYTEQMVQDSARILSGFTVDAFDTWDGFYDPGRHATGAVQVLGFKAANGSPDGEKVTRDYLTYLAHHPATARRIATKLAARFVSDTPSTALVDDLTKVFRSSGTDIRTTLRALVAHPHFKASAGSRVRTPVEDFVATCRVLGVDVKKPTSDSSFARSCVGIPDSLPLFQWPRPDGAPITDVAWSSAIRMLNSFGMHWSMTAGWWPRVDVAYRTPVAWLPTSSIRLDAYVDHLCRMLLGRASSPRLLSAAIAATGYGPSSIISADHPITKWLFVRLAGALLDTPEHMSR